MPVSRALRRLFRILDLEEDQRRIALESAQAELTRLERSMKAAKERQQEGRRLVTAGARSGELLDRIAGVEEARAGLRQTAALEPRMASQETQVSVRREDLLEKRVERRQTEMLIRNEESEDSMLSQRRGQQSLDDWYLSRFHASRTDLETGSDGGRTADNGKLSLDPHSKEPET